MKKTNGVTHFHYGVAFDRNECQVLRFDIDPAAAVAPDRKASVGSVRDAAAVTDAVFAEDQMSADSTADLAVVALCVRVGSPAAVGCLLCGDVL